MVQHYNLHSCEGYFQWGGKLSFTGWGWVSMDHDCKKHWHQRSVSCRGLADPALSQLVLNLGLALVAIIIRVFVAQMPMIFPCSKFAFLFFRCRQIASPPMLAPHVHISCPYNIPLFIYEVDTRAVTSVCWHVNSALRLQFLVDWLHWLDGVCSWISLVSLSLTLP